MLMRSFVKGPWLGFVYQLSHLVAAWEPSEVPDPDSFLRRSLASVAVVDNFLYIDGGEISQLDSEGQPYIINNGSWASLATNSTLSIDLSESWSPSNVTIREIPKKPHAMTRQALWKREDTKALYIWGRRAPHSDRVQDESLSTNSWKFQPDGKGGGEWSEETPSNPTEFRELERSENGAFVSTPYGGFWIGGVASRWTRVNVPNVPLNLASQPIPGMVLYDWKTNQWSNESTKFLATFPPYGTMRGAKALYIPNFGENGIVVLMGGFMSTLEPFGSDSAGQRIWMDFSNITFMDPVSKEWYWQNTTGTAPTDRHSFCMVGVEGDGTYEIFVFGGIPGHHTRAYDDVFVLSLPGFVWTQVPYEDRSPRTDHHCAVVGNRQMLAVGGRNATSGSPTSRASWSEPDPWPQGLGLFDMAEWSWKSEYNASAATYESHEKIKSWYRDMYATPRPRQSSEKFAYDIILSGVDSVHWSSEKAKSFFLPKAKRASAGVIAGAVVGAIAGVGLLALALFWFIRRRRRGTETAPVTAQLSPEDKGPAHNAAAYFPLHPREMDGHGRQVELWAGQTPKQELHGFDARSAAPIELDAHQGHTR